MKKKQSKCMGCLAVKRCVFKVRSTGEQEMLQTKTLLSEQNFKMMLNNGLDRPCPLHIRNFSKTFGVIEPSLSSKVYENITIH